MPETQIKSRKRVKDYGEVFTAEREVKAMCDLIPDDVWSKIDSRFLEPACGNGNFLVEALKRKLDRCNDTEDCILALASIYAIDIQRDNVEEAKKRMLDIFVDCCGMERLARKILNRNIICADSIVVMKELETKQWDEAVKTVLKKKGE